MTVREVALLLKVSTRTVWNLRRLGKLPRPLRVGRSVRWRKVEVERFLGVLVEEA